MKLLKLLEVTRRFGADEHFRLYMPNGGEDGVLIGWRMDWPENHHIEFRGPPYSEWQSGGSDFERVHDRLAGMRATVLHHDSVVDVIPGMEEHGDIAKAINDKGLPEWDADRAFNESMQSGVTINYKGQPKLAVKPERAGKDVLMMLPTKAMDAAFGKDGEGFYVGPGGSGAAIGKRYAGFQDWISKHDTYELPEVYVNENGKLSFTNGRHRYAVLRDAGVDPMPVAMARSGVPNAQKFLKGVIRESISEANYSDGQKTFYHVSDNQIPNGGVIKPQGNVWHASADAAMEKFRPAEYPSRHESVFMFPSFEDAEDVGLLTAGHRIEGYLYEVVPIGESSWHHVQYYENIISEMQDNSWDQVPDEWQDKASAHFWKIIEGDALNYWHGSEFGDAGWELMAPAARVVKYLGTAEDVLYEARTARLSVLTEMADPKQISAAVPKALALLKANLVQDQDAKEYFYNEEGVDADDPQFAEAFAIWKEDYAQRRVGMAIRRMTKGSEINKGMEFRDGKLMVYRMIDANGEDFLSEINTRGLGQYWTWEAGNAAAISGYLGGDDILITGAVDPAHVDWAQTILQNAYPRYAHEKEITIPEGTPVKILNIDRNGESVDPSLYGGRGRTLMASLGEGTSVQMSSDEMIQYLRQHHDANLHQDYIDHIQSFDSFVLRDIPIASIANTELAGLEQAKVAQYKGMDFSSSPPIVMGGGHILDGYHRVSVAKALGVESIKGYVGLES